MLAGQRGWRVDEGAGDPQQGAGGDHQQGQGGKTNVKGIVSWDWGGLLIVLLDRYCRYHLYGRKIFIFIFKAIFIFKNLKF
jgi:hypothetical protein